MDDKIRQKKYLLNLYSNRDITFVKGEGVYLYAENGDSYLDMMSNYGVTIFGYHHPEISNALITQINTLTTLHCSYANDIRARASEALISRTGPQYNKMYWANSGAEAVEAALKFAVLATGKKKFIACQHGYHGKTLGSLSATSGKKYREPFEPLLWNFIHIDYDNPKALEQAIDETTAAFIVEAVQGESGVKIPRPGYLLQVREICSKSGILLILDEIQTGAGRTAKFLASEHEDVHADILCLGKGIAGGIPVGIAITNNKIAEHMTVAVHTSTFGGNPLACSGVLAVLNELNNNALEHIDTIGTYFMNSLKHITSPLIKEVRGKGLMIGIEVTDKRNQILQELQKKHILAAPAGDSVVRFLPPYIIEKEHVDETVNALETVMRIVI
jgi:[amino-group carrier protein]-gamma-(L-lysyl/L-ornithyl)-L-glutamate aminotransferase